MRVTLPVIFLVSCASPLELGLPQADSAFETQALEVLWKEGVRWGPSDLRVTRTSTDGLGMTHIRVQQEVDGIPVEGGEAIVHLDDQGDVASLTLKPVEDLNVDPVPALTAEDALDLALEATSGQPTRTPTTSVRILRQDDGDHLAWRVRFEQLGTDAPDAIPVVSVDAHTGDILRIQDDLWSDGAAVGTGTGDYRTGLSVDTWFIPSWYYLEDTNRGIMTVTFGNTTSSVSYGYDADNTWTESRTASSVEAHWSAARTLDYLADVHGWDGVDGAGGPTYATSLTGTGEVLTLYTDYGSNVVNAYWTGEVAVFGDGDGVYSGALVSLDIVAHELFHGVSGASAGLESTWESAQINESMSDVFAAMVERSADGDGEDIWTFGEDAWTPSTAGDAIRYLDDPAADGHSHDYRSASSYLAEEHDGSGIGNLAFYLVSEGGTHPRYPTWTVAGVGPDAAADIWFRALTLYLTSTADYSDLRDATLQAARDLYGSGADEVQTVSNAWSAVGVTDCDGISSLGSLSGTGAGAAGGTLTLSSRTAFTGTLVGNPGANFDLYLQKNRAGTWTTIASSTTSGSTESVSYTGNAGSWRFKVKSISGSGYYSLCQEY